MDGWEIWMHLVHKPADDVTMAVSIFYIQSIVYIQSIGKRLKKIVFNQAGEMLVASAALFCSVLSYC